MGKKEIQKVKSHPKKVEKIKTSYPTEVGSIVKITIIVLLVLILVYLFTALITGKIKLGNKDDNNSEVTIQYEEILAGESFNQREEEYLVLFYDFTATDASVYSNLLTNYKSTNGSIKYYTVNMASGMNQLYKTEEASVLDVSKASLLKVKDVALIRFVNQQVANYYDGSDAVQAYFNNFGK